MIFKNKFAILFLLLLFATTFFLRYNPALELYPANETYLEFTAYSDKDEGGSSEAFVDTSKGHLHFSYKLGTKSKSPYANLLFHAHELARTIDLKKYRFVDIDIDPKTTSDFSLTLFMYVPGFSDHSYMETHRPYVMKSRVQKDKKHYHLPISDFATPSWWISENRTSLEKIPPTDWSQLTHLMISDFGDASFDKEMEIDVVGLRFRDSIPHELLYAAITTLIGALLLFIGSLIAGKVKHRSVRKPIYNRRDKENYDGSDADNLITFLAENYGDPLMSLELIKKKLGLNNYQINEILKDKFSMQYKQYLNTIRITEAKRLLRETDRQIGTIAEQVGYCYANSFARTFRSMEEITPNQYRQEHRKKDVDDQS